MFILDSKFVKSFPLGYIIADFEIRQEGASTMHSSIKIPIYRIKMMKHLLLLLFAISSLYAAEQPSVCQILFSEREQKSMGFDRQRRMYPPDRARKLSMRAVKTGIEFLQQKRLHEAMAEFNRAWRFAPDNPYSYWMAAIVRSMEAIDATLPDTKKQCFEDSLKLWDKCHALLRESPKEVKENYDLDLAETMIQYGIFLSESEPQKAGHLFRQADALLKQFHPSNDLRGQKTFERAREMRMKIPPDQKQ